jgi:hypothetical protein
MPSAPHIEIVERISYINFEGKPYVKVGYYVIDGDKRIPPLGTPAHVDVKEGGNVSQALDKVLAEYIKFKPGKYP